MTDIETMTRAYIEAIYFTETGDGDQPDSDAELEPFDKAKAFIDCRNFYWAVTERLDIHPGHIDWSQAGHDLWFTRNGHGVGFWDRDDDVYGETLIKGESLKMIFTAIAKAMGDHDVDFNETESA